MVRRRETLVKPDTLCYLRNAVKSPNLSITPHFVLFPPLNQKAAKITAHSAESMTIVLGFIVFAPLGCRLAVNVGVDPGLVCTAMGAGTTVSCVTVTTAPPSWVEV